MRLIAAAELARSVLARRDTCRLKSPRSVGGYGARGLERTGKLLVRRIDSFASDSAIANEKSLARRWLDDDPRKKIHSSESAVGENEPAA